MIHMVLFAAAAVLWPGSTEARPFANPRVEVTLSAEAAAALTPEDQGRLASILDVAAMMTSWRLADLPARIRVRVEVVQREVLSTVGNTSGRADVPGSVLIELSAGAIERGDDWTRWLAMTAFHEFHHLARGWTIQENRFGPGIPIAAVNEGLAQVFGEDVSGVRFERFDPPADPDAWAREILQLPLDADYNAWMNQHPDGRIAIGYRTGRYIVRRAMERSGLSIVELSDRSPEEILELAGY